MINRRKYGRLKVSTTVILCKKRFFHKDNPIRVHIANISKRGTQVISAIPFNKNDHIILTCQSLDKLTSIEFAGKVVWTKPITIKNKSLILIGIRFSSTYDRDFEQVETMFVSHLV